MSGCIIESIVITLKAAIVAGLSLQHTGWRQIRKLRDLDFTGRLR
jgi:hypothetical protein